MTSSSQKIIMNEATGPNSTSEESERKSRTKPHQKITLPIFDKKTIQEAKLWWRRFIQYVKMTHDINLNNMTTDKEILPEVKIQRTGGKDQRYIHLGIGRSCSNGDDKDSKR